MVEGPGDVFICTQCVDLCRNIFQQEKQRSSRSDNAPSSLPSPKEIVEHLDRYVIGQDQAKRFLAVGSMPTTCALAADRSGQNWTNQTLLNWKNRTC